MPKAFDRQTRLDLQPVADVRLNLNCRDEIVPLLQALQHIYAQPKLRDDILRAIAQDLNHDSSRKQGRQGMDYGQILVLAAVRLGCNLDYDKLQDLAEPHRALRQIMGIESAIGALQAGNGLARSRDRSERGFHRYVQLGMLGRNLHVLGKLLIARQDATSQAAHSRRKAAA